MHYVALRTVANELLCRVCGRETAVLRIVDQLACQLLGSLIAQHVVLATPGTGQLLAGKLSLALGQPSPSINDHDVLLD